MEIVSIIIPVFNVKMYLSKAMESVINQTYSNLEIILIDDGSSDGSGQICDEYVKKDDRVYVIHQKNLGLSSARNVGLDLATGEYITFLDPDDIYHPDYIRIMLLEMHRRPVDIVVCRYITMGRFIRRPTPSIDKGIYDRESSLRALIDGKINSSVWNKLYRRELFQTIRFPVGRVYEDREVMFRILNVSAIICVLDKVLYQYRRRPGSITHTISQRNIVDRILVGTHFVSFVRDNTPEIFAEDQLENTCKNELKTMISLYARFNRDENRKFDNAFRRKILKSGNEIEKYDVRIRVAYQMLCKCPMLLKAVYPLYMQLRLFFLDITGK